MREYIYDKYFHIDGRNIPYPVVTSADYFVFHDKVEDASQITDERPEIDELVTQILALKQSCFLLRHTSHSCQSLSDSLYNLKVQLIMELKLKYDYEFDDAWMESLVPYDEENCLEEAYKRIVVHGGKTKLDEFEKQEALLRMLELYKNQIGECAEQHAVILASDVLKMLEELEDELKVQSSVRSQQSISCSNTDCPAADERAGHEEKRR